MASRSRSSRITVLVVDDSPIFVDAIRDLLEQSRDIDVVGVACNGREAVAMTRALRPRLVIMDVQMPVMDGLQAIEEIMSEAATPILVMTADPRGRRGDLTFEALRRGALDLLPKPSEWPGTAQEQAVLQDRVRLLATVPVVSRGRLRRPAQTVQAPAMPAPAATAAPSREIVAIVASAGGPAALATVLERLPADFPLAILVVQHMTPGFVEGFAGWLGDAVRCRVRVATVGQRISPGEILIAPDRTHLGVDPRGVIRLDHGREIDGHRPSGTYLLRSVARAFGARAVGVILTGMGTDGVQGLLEMRRAGALTIAQDGATSRVFGMPRVAQELGAAQHILSDLEIAAMLRRVGKQGRRAPVDSEER